MCCGIPGEDEYWERRREEYENPRRDPDEEPELKTGTIYLDEDELLEIVKHFTGIDAEEAEYNAKYGSVEYKYHDDEGEY